MKQQSFATTHTITFFSLMVHDPFTLYKSENEKKKTVSLLCLFFFAYSQQKMPEIPANTCLLPYIHHFYPLYISQSSECMCGNNMLCRDVISHNSNALIWFPFFLSSSFDNLEMPGRKNVIENQNRFFFTRNLSSYIEEYIHFELHIQM